MHALVIEEAPTSRRMVTDVLTCLGFETVCEAEDFDAARRSEELMRVNLVVLDWNHASRGAHAFVREYRAAGGDACVLMLTHDIEMQRIVEAIKIGVDRYVFRPVDLERVQRALFESFPEVAQAA